MGSDVLRTINLKPLELTSESWELYGQIVGPSFDGKEFDSSDAQLELSRGIPRLYVMHLEDRKHLTFGNITFHANVTQCLGSIGGHTWYLGVAPSSIVQNEQKDPSDAPGSSGMQAAGVGGSALRSKSGHLYVPPSPDDVRVFRVDGPCFLKLHAGTWHAGPFFKLDSMDFYNLELSDTNVVDHTTHIFSKKDRVIFRIDDHSPEAT